MMRLTSIILLFAMFVLISRDLVFAGKGRDRYSLAVLILRDEGAGVDNRSLTNRLNNELSNAGLFFTMSHENMERGLLRTTVDPYACNTVSCAIKAGRELGVQLVVFGSVRSVQSGYSLEVQMVHIASREIVKSASEEYATIEEMESSLPRFTRTFLNMPDEPATPVRPRVTPVGYNQPAGGGIPWLYIGIGALVAGGVGAGLAIAGGSDSGNGNGSNPTTPTNSQLPGPPTFP